MRRLLPGMALGVGCLLAVAATAQAQDHRDPSAWRGAKGWWAVMDQPAPDSLLYSVDMPPGWHITARGPGALLGDSTWVLNGAGIIEMEAFLFPGTSMEGYGIFLGGKNLATGSPSWTGVLLRRDGRIGIVRHRGRRTELDGEWLPYPAITPGDAKEAIRNTLRLEVGTGSIAILVNGIRVAERPMEVAGGAVGLRVGAGLNLHVTKLEVTPRA